MRRVLAAGLILGIGLVAPAVATQPIAPYDDSLWTKGKGGFNTKMNCLAPLNCFVYTVMMNNVSVRGPESAPTTRPKVGERFYVRTELALLNGPWSPVDTYRTKVILPEGVTPSITAPDDVTCAVTWTDDATVRVPGPSECQDPVQLGVEWVFPPVWLDESTDGQVSQFWFPVTANRPISGETIQITGTAVTNPLTLLPNPIVAEVPLYVDPAPTAPTAAITPPAPTAAPTSTAPPSVMARSSATGGTVVSWASSAAPGVTGYRIQQRRLGTKRWIVAGTATASARKFKLRKVVRGKKYQVRVATLVGARVVAWSKPVTITAR